jgi:hypothetical protein
VVLADSLAESSEASHARALQLQERLGPAYLISNVGSSSDTTTLMLSHWRSSIRGQGAQWLVVQGGGNDIRMGAPGESAWANLQTILEEARADGVRTVLMTIPPFKRSKRWSASKQDELNALNDEIRHSGKDAKVLDAYAELGQTDQQVLNVLYDSGDGTSLNETGIERLVSLLKTLLPSRPFPPPAEPTTIETVGSPPPSGQRPGRFRLGPFYVTPTFRIGSLGLDTNVFYTPTDRRTDFIANGGPGLNVVLPVGPARLSVGGEANYLFFAKTISQRKFAGDGTARLELKGQRIEAAVEESFDRTFQRPSFEVDTRILQDRWSTKGELVLKGLGRFGIRAQALAQNVQVATDQLFLGTDLHQTLTSDELVGLLGFKYLLTGKTSLVIEGDYVTDRFPFDKVRDSDSNHIYGGFKIDSETRLFGSAVGGVRLFRPLSSPGLQIQTPYAAVDLSYRVGPKTLFGANYNRDLAYSAFDTSGLTSTLHLESYGVRLEQGLVGQLDLRLFARQTKLATDGSITLIRPGAPPQVADRRDTVKEAGADLGYRFRSRLRVGMAATYTNRASTIADFGIQGLLVGGTVTYSPGR